jgi:hypothetical protein
VRFGSAVLAALLVGGTAPALAAPPAQAQAEGSTGPLCQALDAWMEDPVGAVNATLIVIGHNQADEGTTWARANAQRLANNVIYEYVRSHAAKDLRLTDAEAELTDAITAAVQGADGERQAARERLDHPLSVDLSAFLARVVPACATAGAPISGE